MKNIITLIVTSIMLSACLKHDVLKQESEGNFQESSFYNNGFESLFDISIQDTTFDFVQTPTGLKCRPIFSFKLTESYAQALESNWGERIRLTILEPNSENPMEEFETWDYSELHRSTKRKVTPCGGEKFFNCRLELMTPRNQVMGRVEKTFSIQTP